MNDYRIMSAMVLFRLEQLLGNVILDKAPSIDAQIGDIANSITARMETKRPDLLISTPAELIPETYLEDLFQLALCVSNGSSDYDQWLSLKNLCGALSIYQIRNAVAHPNRPFPPCYWYRIAAIAADPLIQQLGLGDLSTALDCALEGKITPPPDEWMTLSKWLVPNNLPRNSDFEITGLIGRPKESKDLQKYLQSPRISCISVVAPGGVGKTALVIDVLDKACKTHEFHQMFDAVIFVSLKLEKLTASGIEKLDAPTTIKEIEIRLIQLIPSILGGDECENFLGLTQRYGDNSLLLFVDNLETVLRDNPESFDNFQMSLPAQWRLLVTSRVTTNSATCLPIGPLVESTAKHLARIYATRKNASALVQESVVEKIVRLTHCNPLAIRLGVDSYTLGSSFEDAIVCASNDVLNFSYRNLLEVISDESVAVLECLFLQDPQTRIELMENIGATIDYVAKGVHELARTSLITRDSGQHQELYSLYPAIRDLLLIFPRSATLRSEIQQRILSRRDATTGAEQLHSKLPKHHEDTVPSELPEVVRNVLYETNRVLGKLGRVTTPEDALKVLGRLRELRDAYPSLPVIWRYTAKISTKLGDNLTALTDLKHAIEIDPDDLVALKMLGRLGNSLHDYPLSLDCYTRIKTPKKTFALNKSASILDDLAKQYGYPDMTRRVYQEVLTEIKDSASAVDFSSCKQAEALLNFVAKNITHAYNDRGSDLQTILDIARTLQKVNLINNPFNNAEWHKFLQSKGGRIYVDEDRKSSLQEAGYLLVSIYHIPKPHSAIVFAQDNSGIQYCAHYSCASDISWPEWASLKIGDEMAIRAATPEPGHKTPQASEAIIFSLE